MRRSGFGFLEVMVSIVLVAVLASALAVHYRQEMDEARLRIIQHDLDFLRRQLAIHRMRHRGPLPELDQLQDLKAGSLQDPWGHPYVLLREEPAQVVCVGPDGVLEQSSQDTGDDVRLELGQALKDWAPTSPEAMLDGEETVGAGYQIQWLHPFRWGGGKPVLTGMAPLDDGKRGGLGAHLENPHCSPAGGGPAIWLAVMVRRGSDHLPEPEMDRLKFLRVGGGIQPDVFLTGPEGTERLTSVIPEALPCTLSAELQKLVDTPKKPYRSRFDPRDWFLAYQVPVPRDANGDPMVPITKVGIGADVVHGEDPLGNDPLFWERVLLVFHRVALPEDLCPGSYHVQATLVGGSGAQLVKSSLDFEIETTEDIRFTGSNVGPSHLELDFSTKGLADEVVRAEARGGSFSLLAWCDESLLMGSGPPVVQGRDLVRSRFLLPPMLAGGTHRMRLHLTWRSPEHPAGVQVCERWDLRVEK